jgi:hypothetical protein
MNDDKRYDRTAFAYVVVLAVLFYASLAVWWAW